MINSIKGFFRLESATGILLVAAMILAMVLENSSASHVYHEFLHTHIEVHLGSLGLSKPLHHWVNDGLMAIFFLLVGLELKREMVEGQLSKISQVALPGCAAIGGMIMPAVIYVIFNKSNGAAMNGWAIPTATDIAFALGILSLLGNRVPVSLKLFLLTLAILDDLGAIIIIAFFYSTDLSVLSLALSGGALLVLIIMNIMGITRVAAYIVVGFLLWLFVLKSGVHATLAGVALGFAIPLRTRLANGFSPLRHLEHVLHPWVAFIILPLFAFANAGISLEGLTIGSLFQPVPLGVGLGLFLGKQLGVFGVAWLGIKLGLAKLPKGVTWLELYGLAILCGIGFTMSIFVTGLAFEHQGQEFATISRLGILVGSFSSAIIGFILLKVAFRRSASGVTKDH